MKKCQNFLSENFPVLFVKFSIYLSRRVFVMNKTAKNKQHSKYDMHYYFQSGREQYFNCNPANVS